MGMLGSFPTESGKGQSDPWRPKTLLFPGQAEAGANCLASANSASSSVKSSTDFVWFIHTQWMCVSCSSASEGCWPRGREETGAGSWGCDKVEAILSHALPLAAPKRPELPFALIWLDYEGKHWVTGYLLRSYEGPC